MPVFLRLRGGLRVARSGALALFAFVVALMPGCGGPSVSTATLIPHSPAPALPGHFYTVQKGDSLAALSERYGFLTEDVIELNRLKHPEKLEVGQQLFLYGASEKAIASSADHVAKPQRAKKPVKQKIDKNKKVSLAWPLGKGVLSSGFGKRSGRLHKGIDIAVKPGTPIQAAAGGTVIYSDNKQSGYGNLVILRHDNGWVTVYAHNKRNLVDEGDVVRQGAPIAEVGNTGRSTGPHLHFELRIDGKAVDPMNYLPAR